MSAQTGISWCDSTLNWWQGCTKVSLAATGGGGCDNCYAERMDQRFHKGSHWGPGAPRLHFPNASFLVRSWQRTAAKFRAQHGRDRRVFVNSMSDWLDNEVPIEWMVELLDAIRSCPDVTFLLLTKRIGNWRKRVAEAHSWCASAEDAAAFHAWSEAWLRGEPPANVWLGATFVNQPEADRDIPKLLAVPARVRFVSIEPMLGPLNLERIEIGDHRHQLGTWCAPLSGCFTDSPRLHWVICGGESGPHARPMHPAWVRSLRNQCEKVGVAFHFKQWGEFAPSDAVPEYSARTEPAEAWVKRDGTVVVGNVDFFGDDDCVYRFGKAASGRTLDGVVHDAFPALTR